MTRPRIGLSAVVRTWEGAARTGVNAAYVEAVVRAGAVPLILSPLAGAGQADEALAALDGLVLTGGEDVDPARYGASQSPAVTAVSPTRDEFELALVTAARRLDLPVLAVCRGIQVVNVAFGGTLWQDLPTERPGTVNHDPPSARRDRTHAVRLAEGSRAARALGTEILRVNSFHHQAVRDLAAELVATGWSDDGLVEAVEADRGAWLLGVQWHPEELQESGAPDRGLFTALAEEAVSARRDRGRVGRPRRFRGRTPGRSAR